MADAPSPNLPLERSFYIGNMFGGLMFGIQTWIAFQSIYLLRKFPSQDRRTKVAYITFTTVLLLLLCMSYVANALMGEFMWIERRSSPGGPVAWYLEHSSIWFNVLGTSTDVTANLMGDSFLLYRCYVMWSDRLWVLILPALLLLASNTLAIISVVQSALPGSSFLARPTINFAVPWISLACAFNASVTALIAGRIIYMQKLMSRSISQELKKTYTTVIAILVESALPFTVLGIALAVLLGVDSPGTLSLSIIWGSYVGIAPQLIILRVAMGRAWSRVAVVQLTTMRFPTQLNTTTTSILWTRSVATSNTKCSHADHEKIEMSEFPLSEPSGSGV
ncbi:hypothetical protein BDN72DRAFT_895911 [Pluteus cervinus]|uniref:Uncharacterized protein n=1 Tax=Pluteus cervinus TaxID=181527 RepID=A0ACD3B0C8_9AGAR|nr:hypothetical protein BDN72DRAFT_895911 [Pluteus cervinus]